MGLLRLILATAVLFGHTVEGFHGLRLVDEGVAVEAFFMLSGFYMALVLDQTYRGRDAYQVFMENRILRLYPMYGVVLLLTIPIALVGTANPALSFTQLLNLPALGLLLLTHITIVGQDLVYFFAIDPTGLYYIGEYAARQAASSNSLALSGFLLVPQAWTLGFEMLFYAMAPFLVRRSSITIGVLLALSLALRGWMVVETDLMQQTAWYYKFFPTVFWTFAAGILMYRASRLVEARDIRTSRLLWAPAALIAVALTSAYLPFFDHWLFYIALALLVPVTFPLFSRARALGPMLRRAVSVDGFLGELSYPLYISHILVLSTMYTLIPRESVDLRVVDIVAVLAFSVVLLKLIGDPIDRYRARNRDRLQAGPDRATRRREARAKQPAR